MRTDAEIVARIKEVKDFDFFGTETSDLIRRLPFEAARQFLRPEATVGNWGDVAPRDETRVKAEILGYLPFAWGKANDCRGLSAARSMMHMKAWLWLIGDPLAEKMDDYEYYGKPQLREICEKYSWNWHEWDNGRWRNAEDGPWKEPNEVPRMKL